MQKQEWIEFPVRLERETEKALLLDYGAYEAVWFAKSLEGKHLMQLEPDGGAGDNCYILRIPKWLSVKKGMDL